MAKHPAKRVPGTVTALAVSWGSLKPAHHRGLAAEARARPGLTPSHCHPCRLGKRLSLPRPCPAVARASPRPLPCPPLPSTCSPACVHPPPCVRGACVCQTRRTASVGPALSARIPREHTGGAFLTVRGDCWGAWRRWGAGPGVRTRPASAGVFRGGGAGPRPRLQRQAEPRVCGAEGPACGKGSPRKGLGVSSTWSQAQADRDASADLGQCGPRGPGWRKQGPHRAGGRTGSVS